MSFGGKAPGPSMAQLQAQETQARLAAQQEQALAQSEAERQASIRARAGRMGGRSLLMMDETGFFTGANGLQGRLGTGWRDAAPGGSSGAGATAAPDSRATGFGNLSGLIRAA